MPTSGVTPLWMEPSGSWLWMSLPDAPSETMGESSKASARLNMFAVVRASEGPSQRRSYARPAATGPAVESAIDAPKLDCSPWKS